LTNLAYLIFPFLSKPPAHLIKLLTCYAALILKLCDGNYKINNFYKFAIILSLVLNIITFSCLFIIKNEITEKLINNDIHFKLLDDVRVLDEIHFKLLDGEFADVADKIKFKGLSYYDYGVSIPIGWNFIGFRRLEYNTFGDKYDPITGIFIAPYDGFYRFTIFGYILSSTTGVDSRTAFALSINGIHSYVGGGQLSVYDSPQPAYTTTIYLKINDQVHPKIFTAQPVVIGRGDMEGHYMWFQVQFMQKN